MTDANYWRLGSALVRFPNALSEHGLRPAASAHPKGAGEQFTLPKLTHTPSSAR